MPSYRPPRRRRPVPAVVVALLGLLSLWGLVGSPLPAVAADPYATSEGPVLTLPADATFVRGEAGQSDQIRADGDPLPELAVDRLPAGLALTVHGDGSATIAGTPTGPPGPTVVQVSAENEDGVQTEALVVTVQQGPAFVGNRPIRFVAGLFGEVVVRTAGYPAPGIALDGDLPVGLQFADNRDGTATIWGTPSVAPTEAPVTLTAVNVVADTSVTTKVVVLPATVRGGPVTVVRPAGLRRAP